MTTPTSTPDTSLGTRSSTSERSHIVIVEDDVKIADMLANYLAMHGYSTRTIADGAQAVAVIAQDKPALVLLDLMLPGLDGIEVCRAVRATSSVPIIMVTARVDEIDRLLGLEIGADDYICKPFSPREVVARVKALLRRAQGRLGTPGSAGPHTSGHGLRVDEAGQRVVYHHQGQDHSLGLTPVEFRLLRLLLSRPGHVFGRARLLDALHEDYRDVSDRAIDSHVKNLRRKVQKWRQVSGIVSVYGVGYRFDPEVEETAAP